MTSLTDQAGQAIASMLKRVEAASLNPALEEIGSVERVVDGVAFVVGLPSARVQELLNFEDGSIGLVIEVREYRLGCVLLKIGGGLSAGARVYLTGDIVRTPVGEKLLGRVIDPLGAPLDGLGEPNAVAFSPIEKPAPGIVDRALVTKPLLTGVTVIDAMIPLGRGQRELLIGDRKTGKTTVAIDTIINQKSSDVVCIYAAIGQKTSSIKKVIDAINAHGPVGRCIFVIGEAEAPPGAQWITPFSACAIGEYFRDKGKDVLLVIDDLTKHADVHRQISLLLRQPPGREAYPGDVFYLHSRLLERAAALSEEQGGGSLTALPIAETQEGNLTAYIPTNLISITDGQIYFEPKLFYEGQKPAINVGLSVSRVGGKTQSPGMKRLATDLRLDYAQFLELEIFTRFGAMVDDKTRRTIEHGRRIRASLIQRQYTPRSLAQQLSMLTAVKEGLVEHVPAEQAGKCFDDIFEAMSARKPQLIDTIEKNGDLDDSQQEEFVETLKSIIEFQELNLKKEGA